MFECVEDTEKSLWRIVKMREMEPLQIGRIVNPEYPVYKKTIVMRTASTRHFEVMILSPNQGEDRCWTNNTIDLKVELLPAGTKLILTVK